MDIIGYLLFYCLKTIENNRKTIKDRNCKNILYRRNTLMKTKILTKFQVYILSFSHFRAILRTCLFYSVLTVKSSFCEHRLSKNGYSFKSWIDTTLILNKIMRQICGYEKQNQYVTKEVYTYLMSPKTSSYWESPNRGDIR